MPKLLFPNVKVFGGNSIIDLLRTKLSKIRNNLSQMISWRPSNFRRANESRVVNHSAAPSPGRITELAAVFVGHNRATSEQASNSQSFSNNFKFPVDYSSNPNETELRLRDAAIATANAAYFKERNAPMPHTM